MARKFLKSRFKDAAGKKTAVQSAELAVGVFIPGIFSYKYR